MNGQRLTEQLQLVFAPREEGMPSTIGRADAEPVVEVHARLDGDHHPRLELRRVRRDQVRILEPGEAQRVAAVVRQLPAREGLHDPPVHRREDLGTGRAGDELRPRLLEDVEEPAPRLVDLGVLPRDVGLGLSPQ